MTRAARRAIYLKDAFDLTPSEWQLILDYQGGVCFICRRAILPPRKPHTDHDHNTGHVRGILCSQCNRGLGKAEDPRWQWTHEHFTRAGLYLRSYPATAALGRIVRGFPGRIGTKRFRDWVKKYRRDKRS
jgi:Recombination endonuclease VII